MLMKQESAINLIALAVDQGREYLLFAQRKSGLRGGGGGCMSPLKAARTFRAMEGGHRRTAGWISAIASRSLPGSVFFSR